MDTSGGDTVPGADTASDISADPVATAALAISPAPAVAKRRLKKRRHRNCGLVIAN